MGADVAIVEDSMMEGCMKYGGVSKKGFEEFV